MSDKDTKKLLKALKRGLKFIVSLLEKIERGEDV